MKKIGLVNIDTSHPQGFSAIMAQNAELDMQYTALFADGFRGDDEVNAFCAKYGIERVATIEEMAEKTDIGFVQSCNWDKHIEQMMPYVNAGKPVFLDKPIVGSVADVKKVRELVKSGAKIIGSSSARYAAEIQDYLATPVETRGEVISAYVECGVDEFNYGVHVGEILSEIAGAKGISCKFLGTAERDGTKCEMYRVTFENGVVGIYCINMSGWRPFNVSIMTTKQSICFKIDSSKIYAALLTRISNYLKTGEQTTADVESLLNVTEFMLCGKKSRDSKDGAEVTLCELEDGDKFDGYVFEEFYASTSKPIYLK